MEGLIVILLYAFKLAFLASLACVRTKEFSLKSEVKKAYLHAHKIILIMPAIMKEVYNSKWFSIAIFFQMHKIIKLCTQETLEERPKASYIRELLEEAWSTDGVLDTCL